MILVRPGFFGLSPLASVGVYLLDLAVIVLLVGAVRIWLRRAKPRPSSPPLPPPRPEALTALSDLRDRLHSSSLRDAAQQISQAVRRFAEREYGIGLTTQTQEEFVTLISQYPDALPPGFADELVTFLDGCDRAKFTPGADSDPLKTELWEAAHHLVSHAPKPVQPQPEPAAAH
jgi:hypothetical protein